MFIKNFSIISMRPLFLQIQKALLDFYKYKRDLKINRKLLDYKTIFGLQTK